MGLHEGEGAVQHRGGAHEAARALEKEACDTVAGAKDPELAALWAASDSPKGSEEAGEEDGDPLSQKSAGSASSYYSGPTQQMGEDKPDDAEERQG